jgi:hypothetical protein
MFLKAEKIRFTNNYMVIYFDTKNFPGGNELRS